MNYILIHPVAGHCVGERFDEGKAHALRAKGGILTPVGNLQWVNTLHEWSKHEYDQETRTYAGKRVANRILPGPILYVSGPSRIHWSMLIDVVGPEALGGRVSVVPTSAQLGNGLVRITPIGVESQSFDRQCSGAECLVSGLFDVNPTQTGFTAFDFYLSYPTGFNVRWTCLSQVR